MVNSVNLLALLISGDLSLLEQDGSLLLFYFCSVLILIFLILILSYLLSSQTRFSFEKQTTYECGFEPFGDARVAFDIHFYIIGILFLLFDLEIVFLVPWVFSFCEYSGSFSVNFFSLFLFLIFLLLGFIYEWRSNALIWVPVRF